MLVAFYIINLFFLFSLPFSSIAILALHALFDMTPTLILRLNFLAKI
jgi:hypothetical protein